MEQKEPIGALFDSILYYTPDDLNNLIDGLTREQSFYVLSQCVEYAHKSGLLSLSESELASKALRVMNQKFASQDIIG